MCLIHYCDENDWRRLSCREYRARRPAQCDECRRTIDAGERYERVVAVMEGELETYRTCVHCQRARTWLEVVCGGYCYTDVARDLHEHWIEEPELCSFYVGRALVGIRREWKGLKPLPIYTAKRSAEDHA